MVGAALLVGIEIELRIAGSAIGGVVAFSKGWLEVKLGGPVRLGWPVRAVWSKWRFRLPGARLRTEEVERHVRRATQPLVLTSRAAVLLSGPRRRPALGVSSRRRKLLPWSDPASPPATTIVEQHLAITEAPLGATPSLTFLPVAA